MAEDLVEKPSRRVFKQQFINPGYGAYISAHGNGERKGSGHCLDRIVAFVDTGDGLQ